jgi:SET and MYND domain-containing protein
MKEDVATLMFGVQSLSDASDSVTIQRAHAILCKALCNTFTLHSAALDPIGAGLYVGLAPDLCLKIVPSLLNHSCQPNCVAVFEGTTLGVRTIAPVEPGDQLLISYVDVLGGQEERSQALQRSYCFQCQCRRCLTELDPDSPFHTMYASVDGRSDAELKEATKVGLDSLKTSEEIRRKGDHDLMVSECESSLSRQAEVLHPWHWLTVRALQQLVYASIAVGDWERAVEAGRKLTEPLQRYLPQYHPVLAIHWLRQGKLFRVSGSTDHLTRSLHHLTQAVRQLRVVYGPGHATTLEAQLMLQDSELELRTRHST